MRKWLYAALWLGCLFASALAKAAQKEFLFESLFGSSCFFAGVLAELVL